MTANFFSRLLLLCLIAIAIPAYSKPVPESISVVMDNNYPPFVFMDSNGRLQGILIDQWKLWESKTGVKVRISAMDWSEAQKRMRAGEFDVIDTIFKTEQRKHLYDFSQPYQKIEVPVFFNREISAITDIQSLKGFVVAVKSGDASGELLKHNGIDTLLEFNSYEAIILAAKEHKINVFVVDKPAADYYLHKLGIYDQFRRSAALSTGEFHRAVLKGNREMLQLVEDGFSRISRSELKRIESTWYGSSLVRGEHTRYLLFVSCGLAFIMLLLFVWNQTLKKKVAERTAELKAAQDSLQLTRFSFGHAADAIIWITPNASVIDANDAACRLLGYAREELLKLKLSDIDPDFAEQLWVRNWGEIKRKGTMLFEVMQRERQGRQTPVEVSASFIHFSGHNYICAFIRDISERKKMTRMLAESELRLRTLVQTIPDLVWLKNAEGVYLLCNTMFERFFGASESEIVGKTDYDFVDKELADFFRAHDRKAMDAGKPTINEEQITFAADGRQALLETIKTPLFGTDGELIGVLGVARDITEREQAKQEQLKLERKLLHSQKLESLGVLAGGIAHDFNNLLQAVMGNLDIALSKTPPEADMRDNIVQAVNAAGNAAKLTGMMLAYSGKGSFVIKSLNLSRSVEENAAMLSTIIPKHVSLELQLSEELPQIMADEGQLQQVIINLITNAYEAIGDEPGTITLRTGVNRFEQPILSQSRVDEKLPAGEYLFMQVSDTGCGMSNETLERIFDPFFTTKFTGRGLGMSAVLGIVRAHHGALLIESRISAGTSVTVLFPIAETPEPALPAEQLPHKDDNPATGLILVVDDDRMVREVAAFMLHELGYSTICAGSGEEAVRIFTDQRSTIGLVLLDQVMPGMGGIETFMELRRIAPDVRVLLSSGFSKEEIADRTRGLQMNGFIQKPFKMSSLGQEVEKILAGSQRQTGQSQE